MSWVGGCQLSPSRRVRLPFIDSLRVQLLNGLSRRRGPRVPGTPAIEDPVVIRKILTHLGFPTEGAAPRAPPHDLFGWS